MATDTTGAVRLHSQEEYQLFGANIAILPPLLENHFFGHISLDQLITLIDSHPYDTQALQTAVQQFRASKRAKIDAAPIPRQPPPCGPPPPPVPSAPASPHAPKPPPPIPFSPAVPVPPPFPSTTPSSHSIIDNIPSAPDIPDPSPRSRTPRRDTDLLFAELIPVRNAPWEPQAGVEPVGAPGYFCLQTRPSL